MTIHFIIPGNQDDPNGNPIPKIKKTFRQQWTPAAQRYAAWKDYVAWTLIDQMPEVLALPFKKNLLQKGKPIDGTPDAKMEIMIYWANEKHADSESVFGSIADAIFSNDKHLAGEIRYTHAKDRKGKVEVAITINENNDA
ncbi:MAG TPA: hypothetical protein VNJ52_05085 [Patescibacteria group bacterium]|nr:hypothetical protein [Patescibacteria group bacterium]